MVGGVGDMMIRFRVNGKPAPQGSKRHVGGGRMVEQSKAVGPWREAVRAEAQLAVFHVGRHAVVRWYAAPVAVMVVFVLPRPASHYGRRKGQPYVKDSAPRRPAGRPDVDKLARAVLDGLTQGGIMADDSQVVDLSVSKVYASNGEAPGAIIEVQAAGEDR